MFFTMQTQVDVAYVPFIEKYQIYLSEVKKYDIAEGRPKLAAWIEVILLTQIASLCKINYTVNG